MVEHGLDREPGVVVLDGGLGTLLERRGLDTSGDLWSARVLYEKPESIADAHREFFASGARVAISGSYQLSFEGAARLGISEDATSELFRTSVDLARAAAAEVTEMKTWVAASVGPYGAMLADGSEYRGDYMISESGLRRWHSRRLEAISSAGADFMAAETLPGIREVAAVCEAFEDHGVTGWISLTPVRGRTRTGEELREVFALAATSPAVSGIGVNCCDPLEVAGAIRTAREVTDLPVIVYPNAGGHWEERSHTWGSSGEFPVSEVVGWMHAGASVIGGCCRVMPGTIAEIAAAVSPKG